MTSRTRCRLPLVSLALVVAVAACSDITGGVSIPDQSFQFPIGVAVHPRGFALVLSSNFDLAVRDGSLRAVDLNALAERIQTGVNNGDPFNRDLILDDSAIQVGSFGGVVRLDPADDGGLAVLTVRESNSIIVVDLDIRDESGGPAIDMTCWSEGLSQTGDKFPRCDGARHLMKLTRDDPFDLLLLDDGPGDERTAFVTYLRDGAVSAIQIPEGLDDTLRVAYEIETDAPGANDLARAPASGLVYVTRRITEAGTNQIQYFDPSQGASAQIREVELYHLLLGYETRSLAFSTDGVTAAVVIRSPDLLAFLDTSLSSSGEPYNSYQGHVVLAANPSRVRRHGDLMFITSPEEDTIVVVDTRTKRLVDRRDDICRGPFDMDFFDRDDLQWALITCFEDDTLTVVDVDPDSPTFLQILDRVGETNDRE